MSRYSAQNQLWKAEKRQRSYNSSNGPASFSNGNAMSVTAADAIMIHRLRVAADREREQNEVISICSIV